MSGARFVRAICVALSSWTLLAAQGSLDRAREALGRGDLAVARTALLELLGSELPDRNQAVLASLGVFRDAGATDTWLEAAERWTNAHPDDALVQFYRGTTWQDLKHLAKAEEGLGRASALAPGNPGVQESWAWNAALRFDSQAALERSRGATFAGVDRFRTEQDARLHAAPAIPLVLLGVLGLALVVAATIVIGRRL